MGRSVGSVGSQLASLAEEGADAARAGTSLGDHDYDVVVKNSFDYEPIHVTPGRLRPISTWAGCLNAADESPRQPARVQSLHLDVRGVSKIHRYRQSPLGLPQRHFVPL